MIGEAAVKSHREALFEAFSSALFIDECEVTTKLQALHEVDTLFHKEIQTLHDNIINTIEDSKSSVLIKNILNIKNISKTMGTLIKNIVSEVDNTREQMFKILESFAAIEISKDPKKFQKE